MSPELAQFLVFLVALVGLGYLVTRPARRQQRQMSELQADIEIGDEVILSAGIFGTVRSVDDDRVGLEIAEGTVITVARQVVVRRVPDQVDETEAPPAEHESED
ncbi:preprotein translocase subunit YajC [Nocardioides marmorisolisilvae]|uniref:preprotein translocase subunit YajC n=1 Tax=Nocardioides marmorisolisilvae TaxID=1542737 RepID=UPI00162288F0|nr:preprotein translocase subunit YajC [Nocardioides marmorisolisilvae]